MTITDEQLDLLLTSLELYEKECKMKDALILTLREQISLLEARNGQLAFKLDRLADAKNKKKG